MVPPQKNIFLLLYCIIFDNKFLLILRNSKLLSINFLCVTLSHMSIHSRSQTSLFLLVFSRPIAYLQAGHTGTLMCICLLVALPPNPRSTQSFVLRLRIFLRKDAIFKNHICVKCRYRSCFFCVASSLCSIGSFRIRSTFARTVSSSRISFFASLYSA